MIWGLRIIAMHSLRLRKPAVGSKGVPRDTWASLFLVSSSLWHQSSLPEVASLQFLPMESYLFPPLGLNWCCLLPQGHRWWYRYHTSYPGSFPPVHFLHWITFAKALWPSEVNYAESNINAHTSLVRRLFSTYCSHYD